MFCQKKVLILDRIEFKVPHSFTSEPGPSYVYLNLMFFCISLQTFVNDVRIQEQVYVTLKIDDKLRFGYDILLICSFFVITSETQDMGNSVTLSVPELM